MRKMFKKLQQREVWVPSAMPFILFGIIYYLISPAIVLQFLSDDNLFLAVATPYLDSSYFNIFYYLDAFIVFGSFLLGYFLAKAGAGRRPSALDYGAHQFDTALLLAAAFGLLIVYFTLTAYASGARFLTGYETYDVSVLGPFSTTAFMCAWFTNYFAKNRMGVVFLLYFVFCAVLLLGWGSRMFVALGLIALLLGLVSRNRVLLRSVWLYAAFITFFSLMIIVGVLRLGDGELTGDKFIGVLFAEPLFTSITGALYLENSGGRPLYGFPNDFFASVIHFIPSGIFPGKADLLREMTFNKNVESPFGAKSLIVNLYANFGQFYPLFLAALGSYFGLLAKRAKSSTFFSATYFSALPILLLLFFRDGFVTVMKVMFFNGFLAPLLVSLFLIWVSPRTMSQIRGKLTMRKRKRLSPSVQELTKL